MLSKLKLKAMFSSDGYLYINPLVIGERIITFKEAFILFISPGVNYLLFCALIVKTFFTDVNINNTNKIFNEKILTYDLYLADRNSNIETAIIIIIVLTIFVLYISFFILTLYFCLILIIVSIPFKLYPLKYILGIVYSEKFWYYISKLNKLTNLLKNYIITNMDYISKDLMIQWIWIFIYIDVYYWILLINNSNLNRATIYNFISLYILLSNIYYNY